jgi:hypothetical protein
MLSELGSGLEPEFGCDLEAEQALRLPEVVPEFGRKCKCAWAFAPRDVTE